MHKKLDELLLESVQAVSDVSPSSFLSMQYKSLVNVMHFIEQTQEAAYADQTLRKLFGTQNWVLDPQALERFFQVVGEVQFWMLAKNKGILLDRIPEGVRSTPDFRIHGSSPNSIQFEVKTLSVTDGWRALAGMAENSFEARLELQKQISRGERVAMVAHSVAPHGNVPRGLEQTTMCRHLIDKASGNIKQGQYLGAPTFLVLNLMLIDGHFNGNSDLRPVAPGYPYEWSVRTGALWTLAFGSVEQLVHGIPEYEGLPGIEGKLERVGVLTNPDFENVAGLLLIVHRLSEEPIFYGLRRNADGQDWASACPALSDVFHALVGTNWNDDLDTNGGCLTTH
ncbi:hypothetical protein [Azonexus sp. IMCC34839]|uniref:hypothetical protein n=1 Tax=Azonexus sp. IMCC34839 TaxID=3133695 RepID=UPI00399BEC28